MIHRLQEISAIYMHMHQQRIEYLQSTGDYMQYIDTGVKIDSETAFVGTTIDFQIVSIDRNLSDSSVVAGSVLSEGTHRYGNTECMVYLGVFYTNGGFNFSQNSDIYARTIATSNGKEKGISNLNLLLFARNIKGIGVDSKGSCRIFSCTIRKNGDVIRDFIPVRVGNKGYMYDNITKQLYGNAGTGDFVLGQDVAPLHQIYTNKLVEGEDYEIGEMLKADIPISTLMMGLPINSKNFEFERNFIQLKNTVYFNTYDSSGAYSYFIQDYYTKIYSSKLQRTIFTGNNLGSGVHTIIANDNGIVISSATNTTTLRWYGNPQRIAFNNASNVNNTIHLTSSIKVDGVTRYAPCRLLRPIPRNLDAQCKPRVAGECGMIDLISGRFYGNVASSGTFSLAWDEWLKDCTIQFDANYLGWTMQYPPTISYQGRIKVANLPDELTDFGFVKLSKTQVVMGENVWSFNNWGSGTWATFNASYGGGYGCGCSINGSSVGSQQEQVATELSCSIDLQDIIQINKIEFIAYIDQQTTHTVKFTRGFDETLNKQYLISDYDNTRIYAD